MRWPLLVCGTWTCLTSQRRSGWLCDLRMRGGNAMFPADFDYTVAKTLDEAVSLLAQHGEDARLLAGGHSLLPLMKLRLAQPRLLIDIARIPGLGYIKEDGGVI